MPTLETMLSAAEGRGDSVEVTRLSRLISRMDDYARSYSKTQRGEVSQTPSPTSGDLVNLQKGFPL